VHRGNSDGSSYVGRMPEYLSRNWAGTVSVWCDRPGQSKGEEAVAGRAVVLKTQCLFTLVLER